MKKGNGGLKGYKVELHLDDFKDELVLSEEVIQEVRERKEREGTLKYVPIQDERKELIWDIIMVYGIEMLREVDVGKLSLKELKRLRDSYKK